MRADVQDASVRDRAGAEQRGIFALLRDLAGIGLELAHNTVQLAACEARVVLRRLVLRAGLFIGAVLFAALGLLMVLGGGAILLGQESGMPLWLALVLVGCLALVAGAAVSVRMLRRLSDPDLAFPATLAEFQADVETMRRSARGAAPRAEATSEAA